MSASGADTGARIVVLASGGGTNCQALLDACANRQLDADVVAVITNNDAAGVIGRANASQVPVHVVDHRGKDPEARRKADTALIETIASCEPDLVVLAGWMRILGAEVGQAFPIINLHPAKPGEFAGVGAIERAFAAWTAGDITESGVMVHWVPDDGVDVGPTIVTESVLFLDGDTLDGFSRRLHATEHRLIVRGAALALAQLHP